MVRLLKTIGVKSIDSGDRTFLMSFHSDLRPLKGSIQRVGLLQPILVRENVRGAPYQVISGFRRLAVCKQLGLGEIEAFSYARSELGDLEAFEIALNDNLSTRGLNLIEKSMVLHKLLCQFRLPRESVVRNYMPMLGLQPNLRLLDKISRLIQLRAVIRRYIVKEEVSLANAMHFMEFPGEDQDSIGRLFSELKLGENTLKEVLTLFREISLRDGLTTGELIRREIGGIASEKGNSKVHRTQRVRERLREVRYPRLTEMEKAFREKRRRLALSPNVSLQPSPYFEGDALRVEFRFRDLDELRDILSKLNAASDKRELGEMLELAL